MSTRTPAQRKAIAAAIAKKKSLAAMARKASPRVVRGRGAYYTGPSPIRTARGYGDYKLSKNSSIGAHIGAWLGDKAQDLFKSVTGFGDYYMGGQKVKNNSLLSMGNDPPIIKNSKTGGFIVRHREYLQDIITGLPGEFTVNSFKIQPGLPQSFPWLSIIAQNFEQYKLRGMIYEFKSTSADSLNSTNTALGEVIMATEYDSKKPNFVGKVEMQNHQYAVAARQSQSILHPIECAHPQSTLDTMYIRTGAVPEGADSRLYDFGNFQIATVGQQGSHVNIGELWVTYEVEFLKTKLQGEGNIVVSSFFSNLSGVSAAMPFGNVGTIEYHPFNNLQVRFYDGGGASLTFPTDIGNGTFVLIYTFTVSTPQAVLLPTISPTAGSGIVMTNDVWPYPSHEAPDSGVSTGSAVIVQYFYLGTPLPGTPRRITFSGGSLPASGSMTLSIHSVVSGIDATGLTGPYPNPIIETVYSRKPMKRSALQALSEEAALKAEIERLTHKYYNKVETREKMDGIRQQEEEAEEEDEFVDYKEKEIDDGKDDVDLSQSTAQSIADIIAKARAKRAATTGQE